MKVAAYTRGTVLTIATKSTLGVANSSTSQSTKPVANPAETSCSCRLLRTLALFNSTVSMTVVGFSLRQTRSPVKHCEVLTAHWQTSTSCSSHTVQLAHPRSR